MKKTKDAQLRLIIDEIASLLSSHSTAHLNTSAKNNVELSQFAPNLKRAAVKLGRPNLVQLQLFLPAEIYDNLKALKNYLGSVTMQEIVVKTIEEGVCVLAKKRCHTDIDAYGLDHAEIRLRQANER